MPRRPALPFRLAAVLPVLAFLGAACGGPFRTTDTTTRTLAPTYHTFVRSGGVVDASGTCRGAMPPAPVAMPAGGAGARGLVGTQIVRDPTCTTTRQDVHRLAWVYDLGELPDVRERVVSARMTFTVANISREGAAESCRSATGAVGSLAVLAERPSFPGGTLTALGPTEAFPTPGQAIFTLPAPGARVVLDTTAAGGARFTVDVEADLVAALNAATPRRHLAFVLMGSDEFPLTAPRATGADCRTTIELGGLVVEYA